MLYYATYCFVVFTMSDQLGTKCFKYCTGKRKEKKMEIIMKNSQYFEETLNPDGTIVLILHIN